MKNYDMKEFRCRCGCEMPEKVKVNIKMLVDNVLDPLREVFGKPIYVSSGYRCQKHNRAVGGATKSQHLGGQAADITADSPEMNTVLAKIIVEHLPFDQLILEQRDKNGNPQWLHVSYASSNRKEVLLK